MSMLSMGGAVKGIKGGHDTIQSLFPSDFLSSPPENSITSTPAV
jgi:hypothetical protein